MLIFENKLDGGLRPPSPVAYALYAFINVDTFERPLTNPELLGACSMVVIGVSLRFIAILHRM